MYKSLKVLLPALLFVIVAFMQYFSWFPALDNVIHDNIMLSSRPAADNIIIVGIDERSINEIGTWPWPRLFVAEAIRVVSEMGAAAIGVNIWYDTVGEYDEDLILAAQTAGGSLTLGGTAVFSSFQEADSLLEAEYFLPPFDELARHVNVGFLNAIADGSDGVMRSSLTAIRFGDITLRSFPYEVYRSYRPDSETVVRLDRNGQFNIRYVGSPGSFRAVSLWGVINEEYSPALFENAIVLIGPYALGIGDGSFITPMDRAVAMHGIEMYANIIQNFLEGIFVVEAGFEINLALLFLCTLIMIALLLFLKPVLALAVTVALVIALLAGVRLTYDHLHIIVGVGNTIFFLAACYLIGLILNLLSAQDEKQHIRELFGRFVAPEVVNEIISGGVEIQLGGVVKEVTALFVDIRGFTAFSEVSSPEKVVAVVNRYLELTSLAIQRNSGTIDKYIGDATMALFNAPNDVKDHALCAVKAAWAMKQGSVALHKEILEVYGIDLQFGIGINTGTAVVGNMGSDFRMDYTAIGDAITTAARLEEHAQKGQIVISHASYQLVKDKIEAEEIGVIHVKNKKDGILAYVVNAVL